LSQPPRKWLSAAISSAISSAISRTIEFTASHKKLWCTRDSVLKEQLTLPAISPQWRMPALRS
jgi:hypothetical protein